MWVRGNSAEPGARDSDSRPDCVTGQGPFSLWASAMGRGTHPACCVPSQARGEVQRQPWIEKLSKLASPTASCRGGFLLIWQSGAWAWLCDLEQRPLLLWPQSSHLHRRNGRGLDPISQAALPIVPFPPLPMDPLPVPVGCFGCEASVAAHLVPCPQHRLAVPLSSSLFLSLSLTTPISASSFLLGSRFLLSPLCLWTPAPATPGSHSDGCTGTSPPPHSHPGPGDPTLQGAPRFPFPPLLPPPCGAISVEVPLGIGALPPQSPLT